MVNKTVTDDSRIAPQLMAFVHSRRRNEWIKVGNLDAYLRVAVRIIESNYTPCFDIATVCIEDEADRGKGEFTKFLAQANWAAKRRGCTHVFVENVINLRLARFLKRRGFNAVPNSFPTSYVRRVP